MPLLQTTCPSLPLSLPDEGVHEIYPPGHATVIAGTAVQGGGQAVPVAGGYRISGRWTFGTDDSSGPGLCVLQQPDSGGPPAPCGPVDGGRPHSPH